MREVLRETGLAPGTLTLELTETAFSRDPEQMAVRLQELNDLDVELAVDDFGTGFSSLQHLQLFPIDMLKIPKPFIDGVGGGADDSALARAIIDIGQSLGMRVVAEGIERPEQLERLLELGCRFGQGFLLDRPMRPRCWRGGAGAEVRRRRRRAAPAPLTQSRAAWTSTSTTSSACCATPSATSPAARSPRRPRSSTAPSPSPTSSSRRWASSG